MRFLGSKYARNAFPAGALPRTQLGELTALPQTPKMDLRGPTSKGRGGEGGMGGKGGKGRGGEKGRGGREVWSPTFLYSPPPLCCTLRNTNTNTNIQFRTWNIKTMKDNMVISGANLSITVLSSYSMRIIKSSSFSLSGGTLNLREWTMQEWTMQEWSNRQYGQ